MHSKIIQISKKKNAEPEINWEDKPHRFADYWGKQEEEDIENHLKYALGNLTNISYNIEEMTLTVGSHEKFMQNLKNSISEVLKEEKLAFHKLNEIIIDRNTQTVFYDSDENNYYSYTELQNYFSEKTFYIIAIFDYHW